MAEHYKFKSLATERLCQEAVAIACKATFIHFTREEKDISIRNINIKLLEQHILYMKKDSCIYRAKNTIEHLRRLNEQTQDEALL